MSETTYGLLEPVDAERRSGSMGLPRSHPDPSVPRLLVAQRQLAQANHAAFWNLFEAMGGENAMVSWVEESPALANKDYTHVNQRGAHRIAGLLFGYLMQQYAHPAPAAGARADSTGSPARDSATATRY